MNERFERFNEITFEAYCKTAIDNAVRYAAMKKQKRAEIERPLSELNDAILYRLCAVQQPEGEAQETVMFYAGDLEIPVQDPEIAQALSFLPQQKREIILLSYFEKMSDSQIARRLKTSKSTIQRQRAAAISKLRTYFGVRP